MKSNRDWSKFENDEIYAIWNGYLRCEFPGYGDPLCHNRAFDQSIRLTPMEIITLVEELIKRLDLKEKNESRNS